MEIFDMKSSNTIIDLTTNDFILLQNAGGWNAAIETVD